MVSEVLANDIATEAVTAKLKTVPRDRSVASGLEVMLAAAVSEVAALSPAFNWVGIYLLDGDMLELGPYIGAPTEHTRIPVGTGVCGTAVARNEDINVPDVRAHDNYLACSVETQSELVVLIHHRDGRIVGQIDIDSHRRAAFGPEEVSRVRQVARRVGAKWPEA